MRVLLQNSPMYQISFSESSAAFFKNLSQTEQMAFFEEFGKITPFMLEEAHEPIRKFKNHEQNYYRYRWEDWRLYFTFDGKNIRCEFILNKNTWSDFKVRVGLKDSSDAEIEENPEFFQKIQEPY